MAAWTLDLLSANMLKLNFCVPVHDLDKKKFPSAAKCVSCVKCQFACVDFSNLHILIPVDFKVCQHPLWCVTRGPTNDRYTTTTLQQSTS